MSDCLTVVELADSTRHIRFGKWGEVGDRFYVLTMPYGRWVSP